MPLPVDKVSAQGGSVTILDISPGYLDTPDLELEHQELLRSGPEPGMKMRFAQVTCELALRNQELPQLPLNATEEEAALPELRAETLEAQFAFLKERYGRDRRGRIPLPKNISQLWSHHKYSVMARSPELYKKIGPLVAADQISLADLALELTLLLRRQPSEGRIRNALHHMWGYVSDRSKEDRERTERWTLEELLREIQKRASERNKDYLLGSTALSDLMIWARTGPG